MLAGSWKLEVRISKRYMQRLFGLWINFLSATLAGLNYALRKSWESAYILVPFSRDDACNVYRVHLTTTRRKKITLFGYWVAWVLMVVLHPQAGVASSIHIVVRFQIDSYAPVFLRAHFYLTDLPGNHEPATLN